MHQFEIFTIEKDIVAWASSGIECSPGLTEKRRDTLYLKDDGWQSTKSHLSMKITLDILFLLLRQISQGEEMLKPSGCSNLKKIKNFWEKMYEPPLRSCRREVDALGRRGRCSA